MRVQVVKFWPFLIIFFLWIIFFNQFIFQGKVLLPLDLVVGGYYPWLDYKWGYQVGVPVKNPGISDVVSVIYPIKALAVDLIKKGELPLWNWYMFAGYPLFANLQMGLLFPTILFYFILSTPMAWTLQVATQPLLAMIFMFLFLQHLKLEKLPSLLGAIIYGFSGFSMIWLQWNVLAAASSFLPLLLLLVDKFIQSKDKRWGVLFSIALATQIFASYPQITIFSILALIFWLFTFDREIKIFSKWLFFLFLGLSLTAILIFPALEFFQLSQRKIESVNSSFTYLPWRNLLIFLAPDYFGNQVTGNFWGVGEYTLMTIYTGLVPLILAIIGFISNNLKKEVKYFGFLFLMALLITLPNPLAALLYNLGLWGGSAISTTRVAFLINLSIAALAGFGLQSITKNSKKQFIISLSILILVILICISTYLLYHYFKNFHISVLMIRNLQVSLRNLVLPGILSLATSIIFFLNLKKITSKPLIQIFLIVLTIFELFRFGLKFNTFNDKKLLYPDTPITEFLKNHSNERVDGGDVIPANMWVPFNLESVAGYDAVYPILMAKYLAVLNAKKVEVSPSGRFGLINDYTSNLFDLTSTKYVLALKRNKDKISEGGEVSDRFRLSKFKQIYQSKSVSILENTKAAPRAFFVSNIIPKDDNEALKEMINPNFSLGKSALVSNVDFTLNTTALDTMTSYQRITNNHVAIKTNSSEDAFLVTLDSYYPGWKAKIDSEPTKIYKADYAFMGVFVPKGNHNIEFTYFPDSLRNGAILSLFSLLILFFVSLYPSKR